MLNIYLARHGQDLDNVAGVLNGHRDLALTELGLNQAKQLAEFIKSKNIVFDKVYSSPLKRAYQTALEVTKRLKLTELEILPLLIERDFGVMTGKFVSEINDLPTSSLIKTKTITYFLEVAGAETFPETLVRAKKLLETINRQHQTGNILLVSHGDFGKMIYAAYYNLPWLEVLQSFHFGNTELILLTPDKQSLDNKIFKAPQFNN